LLYFATFIAMFKFVKPVKTFTDMNSKERKILFKSKSQTNLFFNSRKGCGTRGENVQGLLPLFFMNEIRHGKKKMYLI